MVFIMGKAASRRWTREESITVLSLYVQIPFGKMHASNPSVITVSKQVERTPSSVALKLVNFASLDPSHKKRGVSGMSNTSKLDREIWQEFYGNWQVLAAHNTLSIYDESIPPTTETRSLIKTRRGQQFFRRTVMAAYGNQCCLTGISAPQLLRASHIVPWSVNEKFRLSPDNGLLLNSLHDAAFDQGLIAFDEDNRLIISNELSSKMPHNEYEQFFKGYHGKRLQMPERFTPQGQHLAYHRENIFCH